MRTVSARHDLPDTSVGEAEALWFNLNRWSSFVDGFARVARLEGNWPLAGARVIWDSREGGRRERVVEKVVEHKRGEGQRVQVEDAQLTGTQSIRFIALDDEGGGTAVELELSYELKRHGLGRIVSDLFLVRHELRESLRRTLARFAVELEADRELAS